MNSQHAWRLTMLIEQSLSSGDAEQEVAQIRSVIKDMANELGGQPWLVDSMPLPVATLYLLALSLRD
jgi:hypothetical protein